MFKVILILFYFIFQSSISYSFDNKKCNRLNSVNYDNYDIVVEKSLETYGHQWSKVFGTYYVMYKLTEQKCPFLFSNYTELSRKGIYDTMLNKFPTNNFIEKENFKQCMLSHLDVRDKVNDKALVFIEKQLDKSYKVVLDHYEASIKKTYKSNESLKTLPNKTICELYYATMWRSSKGDGRIKIGLNKDENIALTEIKKSNQKITNYCSKNNCDF